MGTRLHPRRPRAVGALVWLLRFGPLAAAAAWIALVAAPALTAAPAVATAQRVLTGSAYGAAEIRRVLPPPAPHEISTLAWARAILALRLYDLALGFSPGSDDAEGARREAESAVRASLAASPAAGYLWFALYALTDGAAGRFTPTGLALIERSYALAPWEGWVAMRRSPALMPRVAELPPSLRERVEAEFAVLLRQNILSPLQAIFAVADPPLRLRILEHVNTLPLELRGRFLRGVAREIGTERRT